MNDTERAAEQEEYEARMSPNPGRCGKCNRLTPVCYLADGGGRCPACLAAEVRANAAAVTRDLERPRAADGDPVRYVEHRLAVAALYVLNELGPDEDDPAESPPPESKERAIWETFRAILWTQNTTPEIAVLFAEGRQMIAEIAAAVHADDMGLNRGKNVERTP